MPFIQKSVLLNISLESFLFSLELWKICQRTNFTSLSKPPTFNGKAIPKHHHHRPDLCGHSYHLVLLGHSRRESFNGSIEMRVTALQNGRLFFLNEPEKVFIIAWPNISLVFFKSSRFLSTSPSAEPPKTAFLRTSCILTNLSINLRRRHF